MPAYYINVLENIPGFNHWALSEQGFWGVPVPYFTRIDTGEVLADAEVSRYVSQIIRSQEGSLSWHKLPVFDLLPPRYKDQAHFYQKGDHVFNPSFNCALSWDFALNNKQLTPKLQAVEQQFNQV